MRYFLLNLALHLLITLLLLVLVCITVQRNRGRKTKHVVSYFFPVAFTFLFLAWNIVFTIPRLRDISGVLNDNYYTQTGEVEKISAFKDWFVIDGVTYYMNPKRNDLEEGDVIRIRHTRYSRYTIQIIKEDSDG